MRTEGAPLRSAKACSFDSSTGNRASRRRSASCQPAAEAGAGKSGQSIRSIQFSLSSVLQADLGVINVRKTKLPQTGPRRCEAKHCPQSSVTIIGGMSGTPCAPHCSSVMSRSRLGDTEARPGYTLFTASTCASQNDWQLIIHSESRPVNGFIIDILTFLLMTRVLHCIGAGFRHLARQRVEERFVAARHRCQPHTPALCCCGQPPLWRRRLAPALEKSAPLDMLKMAKSQSR